MPESFRKKVLRNLYNFWPVYRRTGGRIIYLDDSWQKIRVKIPLNLFTKNYVGTIYGGSIYGAVDPIYMVGLIKLLGPDYVVWDKGATIRFKKPGRSTLYADFVIDDEEINDIKKQLEEKPSIDRTYTIEVKDAEGEVHAVVEKILYVANKKKKRKGSSGS